MNVKEAQEKFENARQAQEENYNLLCNLIGRKNRAKNLIVELEEKLSTFKEQRPQMLADEVDITGLNQKMKNIDEEIVIKKDEVIGIDTKLKTIEDMDITLKREVNFLYKDFVCAKMEPVAAKFNKQAKLLAEIAKDYLTMEELSDCNYSLQLRNFNFIPQIGDDENPFLKDSGYGIYQKCKDAVIKKYNLTDFSKFQ